MIKCLCLKTHANASKFVFETQLHTQIHSMRTLPTNTNHRVNLGFTHSDMKQLFSLFKFKWLKPLHAQYLAFCVEYTKSKP